jgi:RimJ/RimL family protein N-acetyltransferase
MDNLDSKDIQWDGEVVKEVENWAKEKGCTVIRCGILVRNERVQRLMTKVGFRETLRLFEKEVGAK